MVEVNGAGNFEIKEFPAGRRRIDIGDYYADDSLIRGSLGWRPRCTLRKAIERTLRFYRREIAHYL
jgi:UDP-glucose 4-epimerase